MPADGVEHFLHRSTRFGAPLPLLRWLERLVRTLGARDGRGSGCCSPSRPTNASDMCSPCSMRSSLLELLNLVRAERAVEVPVHCLLVVCIAAYRLRTYTAACAAEESTS